MNIEVSNEDRKYLIKFFDYVKSVSDNSNLLYVDNVEALRIALERFIYNYLLHDNLVFNLFLIEVRHDELMYKLKKNNSKYINDILDYNTCNRIFPVSTTVKKWYEESTYAFDLEEEKNNKTLTRKKELYDHDVRNNYVDMINEIMR